VDFEQPLAQKKFYYVLWELDQAPIGHSNINKIVYGQEAYMHLHLWHSQKRKGGHGTFFIQESINRYFELFHLQNLFCEPYALNPAPNKTLAKAGFELLKTYETTPGWINFNQPVNRWVLTKETWLQASKSNKLRTSAAPQAGGLGG
ncbi:MAG: GNAT family protein, partial [Chloroflexota bacterium]